MRFSSKLLDIASPFYDDTIVAPHCINANWCYNDTITVSMEFAMYIEYECKQCGKTVRKQQQKNMNNSFCSRTCKSEWQRTQKPVDREWLYQKYIVEKLDCTQIAKIVNRNSKRVWEWLKDYDIPTRKRGTTGNGKNTKPMLGKKHTPETRKLMSQICIAQGRVPKNRNGAHPMKGRKGARHPKWNGGFTPERNEVYGSNEWKEAVKAVWKRDNATCQRCGLHRSQAKKLDIDFDIHHIVGFAVKELRTEVSNLILLCEPCHYWVHGSKNVNKEFIK